MDIFSFPGGLGRTCAEGSNAGELQAVGQKKRRFYSLETLPSCWTTEHPSTPGILYYFMLSIILAPPDPIPDSSMVVNLHGLQCHKEL